VTSKKPILEFYSVVKTVQYIGCLFATCAHNLLSSCLPSGCTHNLLLPHLPGVQQGRLDIHWYEYVCYSCYFHSLATKIAVLVTVTRSCFCCCDFLRGNHDVTTLIVVPCCWLLQWRVPLNAFHHGPTQDKEGATGCYHVALQ
jgi:hypothetical protein